MTSDGLQRVEVRYVYGGDNHISHIKIHFLSLPTLLTLSFSPPYPNNRQPENLFCELTLRAKVDLDPSTVYAIITEPAYEHAFRDLAPCLYRKTLWERPNGDRAIEMVQEGRWKFLWFSGSFPVKLHVEYARSRGVMSFKLLEGGFMKVFDGKWTVEEWNDARHRPLITAPLDASASPSEEPAGPRPRQLFGHSLPDLHSMGRRLLRDHHTPCASYVTLTQAFLPSFAPPYPLDGYVRKIAAKVAETVLEDIRLEAARVRQAQTAEARRRHSHNPIEGLQRGLQNTPQAAARFLEALPFGRVLPSSAPGLPPRTASLTLARGGPSLVSLRPGVRDRSAASTSASVSFRSSSSSNGRGAKRDRSAAAAGPSFELSDDGGAARLRSKAVSASSALVNLSRTVLGGRLSGASGLLFSRW